MTDLDALKYPIGRFARPGPVDAAARAALISAIEEAPAELRSLVAGLSDAQLDTPYRPGGWTIRQVVHHVPDSHANAYVRMKLGATEDAPTIRTYQEGRWAELPEARTAPVAMSLDLLDALHRRWVAFLRALPAGEFARTVTHPDWGVMSLDDLLAQYAWHGRHHAAHIRKAVGIRG